MASPHDQYYSMHSLESYAKKLVQDNLQKDEAHRTSCCIAVAGGGATSISSLASTSGASQMLLDGAIAYSRKSYLSYVGLPSSTTGFYYTSLNAAKLASIAALHRAFRFQTGDVRRMPGCIGVGCASALTSSAGEKESCAYIVATKADGEQLALDITMKNRNKTRLEEEVFVSYWVLRAIDLIQKGRIANDDHLSEAEDEISVEAVWTSVKPNRDEGIAAAKRVLDGNEAIVVLVPVYEDGRPVSYRALDVPTLPDGALVFPGSFNPPHKGHIALAQAALRTENKRKRCSRSDHRSIFMELSIANADKPPIDPETVSERLGKFLGLDALPSHWGVILTRAPLFSEKVAIVQNCIDTFDGSTPDLSFVIGTDTLVRIIDPKYYNNNKIEMEEALRSLKGVNFLIGGRLDQKTDADEPYFVTGKEEIKDLPEGLQQMFTIIGEEEFRVDISSTQIRNEKNSRSPPAGPTNVSK